MNVSSGIYKILIFPSIAIFCSSRLDREFIILFHYVNKWLDLIDRMRDSRFCNFSKIVPRFLYRKVIYASSCLPKAIYHNNMSLSIEKLCIHRYGHASYWEKQNILIISKRTLKHASANSVSLMRKLKYNSTIHGWGSTSRFMMIIVTFKAVWASRIF